MLPSFISTFMNLTDSLIKNKRVIKFKKKNVQKGLKKIKFISNPPSN